MVTENENPNELLGELLAAKHIGGEPPLDVKTMQSWRLKGTGPAFLKIGRLVRYRRADLDSWLESRRRQSTSDKGE